MTDPDTPAVVRNPWRRLRQYTDARIGLGRAGVSLPTSELLDFQLAHARARDSVHSPLDVPALTQALANTPKAAALGPPLCLHSQAPDRKAYLQRPDWGRQLSEQSVAELGNLRKTLSKPPHLAIVIADGLSSRAVQQNATGFLEIFLNDLGAQAQTPYLTPPLLVEQGRVAIGDPIGQLLGACQVIVLIGERPGLSSPDSLGIYLTHAPEPGLPDSRRNCLSNIRPAGLSFGLASQRLLYLIREAERLKTSGVALKDRSNEVELDEGDQNRNFLVQGKRQ
jgi:ethanolamine ammonia-lyase small subunit